MLRLRHIVRLKCEPCF